MARSVFRKRSAASKKRMLPRGNSCAAFSPRRLASSSARMRKIRRKGISPGSRIPLNDMAGNRETVKEETPPALLYKDMATTSSVIRDLFSEDVQRVSSITRNCSKRSRCMWNSFPRRWWIRSNTTGKGSRFSTLRRGKRNCDDPCPKSMAEKRWQHHHRPYRGDDGDRREQWP